MMAKGLIDAAGPNVLRRLWDAFALSDEQLAGVLGGRVHPDGGPVAGIVERTAGRGLINPAGREGKKASVVAPGS